MSNDKIKKFFFPSEDDGENEQPKTEQKIATNRDLYQQVNEEGTLNNKLYGGVKNEPVVNKTQTPTNTVVFNPSAHEDAETIAQQIILGNSVIVNLEHLLKDDQSKVIARRIIDFICGVAFALSIDVKKINASTFLISKDSK